MSNNVTKPSAVRLQFALIFAVFAIPLILAALMYYGGGLQPRGGTNSGTLLQPFVNLVETVPDSALHASAADQWIMLYAAAGACAGECREGLYRMRQIRLMLGKDMSRVTRVFLHGDTPPDTVFIEEQHPGLKTMTDNDLGTLLEGNRPAELPAGGSYLIDPLGNLVMYFSPDLDPGDVADDIGHLLGLSHIG